VELFLDGGCYVIINLVFLKEGLVQYCVVSLRIGEVIICDFHRYDLVKVIA
jgi:hypothetical protein